MSKTITKVIAGIGIVAGLGMAALPLSSYAASHDVTVSFKVNSTIVGETVCGETGDSAIGGTSHAAGGIDQVICEVQYGINSPAAVSIVDKDANNSLVGVTQTNTIAAFGLTANIAALSGGTEGWGFKFEGNSGITAASGVGAYNGVPTGTAKTVGTNAAAVANAEGTFTFGVQTAASTVADTYSDVVTIAVTPAA